MRSDVAPTENTMKLTPRECSLTALIALLALTAACLPHIAQDAGFHQFADTRRWLGVSNGQNVLSNLPFFIAGWAGLALLRAGRLVMPNRAFGAGACLFFIGLILTAAVSSEYHAAPGDHGLVLDRLGMTLAFAGTFAMLAADKVSARAGWMLGALALVAGPASVLWWTASGDLAPYAVVQFGGMLLLLLAALFWREGGGPNWGWVLGLYALAKLLEVYDHEVFAWSGHLVAGHALKHLVAACTAPVIIVSLLKPSRNPAASDRRSQAAV